MGLLCEFTFMTLHSPLSADAFPQATSPNYLALGPAIRDALAVAFSVAGEHNEVECLAQGHCATVNGLRE